MEGTEGTHQPHLVLANKLFLLTQPDVDDIEKVRLRDEVMATVVADDFAPLYETLAASLVLELDQKVLDSMRVKIAGEIKKLDEKFAKKDPDTSSSKLHNGGYSFTSAEISPKPLATPAKITKMEPVISGSNLHNCGYLSTPTGNSPKPMAKRAELMKKEPTTNYGSDGMTFSGTGSNLKDTKMAYVNSHTKESGDNLREVKVKSEPVDDDDAPPSSIINISFSAVMSSYEYLELPANVKLGSVKSNSTVIFLKNGDHLWPVLYQTKLGLKALTQSWGLFARETCIQLGDRCVFVPENEPNVFTVHTTRE